MKLSDLAHGEPWMDPLEKRDWTRYRNSVRRMFQQCGVKETPLLTLRVADVGVSWLLARRLERALIPPTDLEADAPAGIAPTLADHIGKARERLRKALRELEDACARLGTPVHTGLADALLPLVRPTAGLLLEPGLMDDHPDADDEADAA